MARHLPEVDTMTTQDHWFALPTGALLYGDGKGGITVAGLAAWQDCPERAVALSALGAWCRDAEQERRQLQERIVTVDLDGRTIRFDKVAECEAALADAEARAEKAEANNATLLRRIAMLDQLTAGITSYDDLTVDAGALMTNPLGVRYYRLHEADGQWHHSESGNGGTLGHLLRGIAWSYDVPEPGAIADGLDGEETRQQGIEPHAVYDVTAEVVSVERPIPGRRDYPDTHNEEATE